MVRDSFLKRLYLNLKQHLCMINTSVAIAVSGGVDSMVLLYAAYFLKDSPLLREIDFKVVTIDHGVREESRYEVEYVSDVARQLGFESIVYSIQPEKTSEHYLHSIRKSIWEEVTSKYDVGKIWLAHHKDDVIEHVLLQLLRGEELRGLTSMHMCDEKVARPLMVFSKRDIYEFAHRHGITYFEDETNNDVSIPRNFIRHKVIPVLKEAFDVENIWHAYSALSLQRDAMDKLVSDFVDSCVKISQNMVVIEESWPIVVEASIFILKKWGITPTGKVVRRIAELGGKHPGSRVAWKDLLFIKTDKGLKIVRGEYDEGITVRDSDKRGG